LTFETALPFSFVDTCCSARALWRKKNLWRSEAEPINDHRRSCEAGSTKFFSRRFSLQSYNVMDRDIWTASKSWKEHCPRSALSIYLFLDLASSIFLLGMNAGGQRVGWWWRRQWLTINSNRNTEMAVLVHFLCLVATLVGVVQLAHGSSSNSHNRNTAATADRQTTTTTSRMLEVPRNIFHNLVSPDNEKSAPAVLLPADNALLDSDFRIVGGTVAPAGKFPFYVNTLRPVLCGGTLIHDDIVLSAARTFGDDG
jgi:hypothetical protein